MTGAPPRAGRRAEPVAVVLQQVGMVGERLRQTSGRREPRLLLRHDLKCLGGMDEDDAFNTSFIVSAICAVIGPINAELNLDCNTAHGAAWVLFPVLLASHALAM